MNHIVLIGRLTGIPELKYTQANTAYTRFSIAVDRPVKQGEEKQTDFFSIVAWGKTAEFICKYFTKGQKIALTGSVRTGSYTDRSGNKHYTFDVWANNVEFCESKSNSMQNTQPVSQPADSGEYNDNPIYQYPVPLDLKTIFTMLRQVEFYSLSGHR